MSHLATGAGRLSGTERDALWLIAVGALLIALSALFGGHLGGLTGRPVGRAGKRQDRLVYAVGFAGAVLVATGSFIGAFDAAPAAWIAVLTLLGAAVMFWLVAAWRLRVDSGRSLKDTRSSIHGLESRVGAPESVPAEVDTAREEQPAQNEWDARRYERQLRWRWCLRHVFDSEGRAGADAERALGNRPSTS